MNRGIAWVGLWVVACSGSADPPPSSAPPPPIPAVRPPPVEAPPGVVLVASPHDVALGTYHGCAVHEGSLSCWGRPLLALDRDAPISPIPTRFQGTEGASAVAISGQATCFLAAGEVRCFGEGGFGDLGNGAALSSATPVSVLGATDVVDLDGGSGFCAVRASGVVSCWGGGGAFASPSEIAGLPPIAHVEVGESSRCALGRDGTVWCWGRNAHGELGDGTVEDRAAPVRVLEDARSLSVGQSVACATRGDGTLSCWGHFSLSLYRGPPMDCESAPDGDRGSVTTWCPRPTPIPGVATAAEVAVGSEVIVVRHADGSVTTLDTSLGSRVAPMDAHGPEDMMPTWPLAAAAGIDHLVAYGRYVCGRRNGELVCFGHEGRGGVVDVGGELGLGERGAAIEGGAVRTITFPPTG